MRSNRLEGATQFGQHPIVRLYVYQIFYLTWGVEPVALCMDLYHDASTIMRHMIEKARKGAGMRESSVGKVILRTLACIGLLFGFGLCFVNQAGSVLQFIAGVLLMLTNFLILCDSEGG